LLLLHVDDDIWCVKKAVLLLLEEETMNAPTAQPQQ